MNIELKQMSSLFQYFKRFDVKKKKESYLTRRRFFLYDVRSTIFFYGANI